MDELQTALFHKFEVDGKVYYECKFVLSSFTPNDRYDNLHNRGTSNKKDFYVTAASEELLDRGIKENNIFVEDNNELNLVKDKKLLSYIRKKHNDEATINYIISKEGTLPMKLTDDCVKKMIEDAKCQKSAIRDIVSTIVYNRELNYSSLTAPTKALHHDNILLYGPIGNGEDIILDALQKNLPMPVIRLRITGDVEYDTDVIAQMIEESNRTFNGNALVIVEFNSKELAEEYDGDVFTPLKELTSFSGVYKSSHLKVPIKFEELTYLTSITVPDNLLQDENVDDYFMVLTGLTKTIKLGKLTKTQIHDILFNGKYSVLKYCESTALKYRREFAVDKGAINDAIRFLYFFDGYLSMLNSAILESFKNQLENKKGKIIIGREILNDLTSIMAFQFIPIEQAPENKVNEETNIDQVEMITSKILKTIRGQDRQVRDIVSAIVDNQEIANDPEEENPESNKENILIRGASGTGKTEIIRLISKIMNIPMVVEDATRYTEEGYVGESVTDMLIHLYRVTGENKEATEKGIIVIDEIDKKAREKERGNDVSRAAVLNSLLKMIEGETYQLEYKKSTPQGIIPQTVSIDTRRITFIILGAFDGLNKIREKRIQTATKPKNLGFQSNEDKTKEAKEIEGINRDFINEDYIEFGFTDQFINRFDEKIYLNDIDRATMIDIMKFGAKSPLLLLQKRYEKHGVELEFTDDFCEKLADIAMTKKSGARSIKEVFSDLKKFVNFNAISKSKYSKITFTRECFDDPNALILYERGKTLQKECK